MRKFLVVLFICILITILSAKPEFAFIGGINRGIIKYNDDYKNDTNRIAMRTGLSLCVEVKVGYCIIGSAFIQRGTNYKSGALDYIGSYTFNYLSGYALANITYQEVLSGFSGFQLGKGLNGTQEGDVDSSLGSGNFLAKDLNLDFGIIFGADIMYNSSIGIRASCYIGLTDILNDLSTNYNIKHRGFGIYLIYKI